MKTPKWTHRISNRRLRRVLNTNHPDGRKVRCEAYAELLRRKRKEGKE